MLLLGIRFLVEILGLLALGYWGVMASSDTPWRIALAIGAPLALALAWALVVAPNADNRLPPRARELIGTGLLVLAAGALALAGQPGWAITLAVVVLVDQILILVLDVRGLAGAAGATASNGSH